MEDDGWGEFTLDPDEAKAQIVIGNVGEFVTYYHCLFSPALDLDKYIAALIKKHICPAGKQMRHACPCDQAAAELRRDGYTSCDVFVTKQYLKSHYADCLQSCKEKTRVLITRYRRSIPKEGDYPSDITQHCYSMVPANVTSQSLKEEIENALTNLAPREQRVLKLRFGLEDGRSRTLEEAGKELNVTRERIRQIEAKALRRLRHPSRSRELKEYLAKVERYVGE